MLCESPAFIHRFRHLDTTVGLPSSRRNSATGAGSSPSPENELAACSATPGNGRSPKRSPILARKKGVSPAPSPTPTTNNNNNNSNPPANVKLDK